MNNDTLNHAFIKALRTRATQARLANKRMSYRFRLNAIATAGQRAGKVWS